MEYGPLDLIDTEEVAELLGLTAYTVRIWRSQDFGPPYFKFSRKCVRYKRAEVHEWIAKTRVSVSTDATRSIPRLSGE